MVYTIQTTIFISGFLTIIFGVMHFFLPSIFAWKKRFYALNSEMQKGLYATNFMTGIFYLGWYYVYPEYVMGIDMDGNNAGTLDKPLDLSNNSRAGQVNTVFIQMPIIYFFSRLHRYIGRIYTRIITGDKIGLLRPVFLLKVHLINFTIGPQLC